MPATTIKTPTFPMPRITNTKPGELNPESKTCKEEIERDVAKIDNSMGWVMVTYEKQNMKIRQNTISKSCLHSETHQGTEPTWI